MLRKTLIEADKLFNKFDLHMVTVYSSAENHCCMSCKTNDDLVFLYVENKNDGYVSKEFSLRNWNSMHSIINSFYSEDDDNSMKIKVETDESNYPNLMKITSGRLKMTYFLQNYNFISNQNDLKEEFDKKRFNLKKNIDGNADNLDATLVKDISKMSMLVNESYFRIGSENGQNYIYFGNENQSVDNGKILIGDIGGINNWKEDIYFSVEYFSSMYRSLSDNIKIKFMPMQIIMTCETDDVVKVGIIRGKNM